jgi:hypothetical protein
MLNNITAIAGRLINTGARHPLISLKLVGRPARNSQIYQVGWPTSGRHIAWARQPAQASRSEEPGKHTLTPQLTVNPNCQS